MDFTDFNIVRLSCSNAKKKVYADVQYKKGE